MMYGGDIKGTEHLYPHLFLMAIFSSGQKIFKIAFKVVEDNSWKISTAPFC